MGTGNRGAGDMRNEKRDKEHGTRVYTVHSRLGFHHRGEPVLTVVTLFHGHL